MKAEKTRNFLRFYFPYREEISREAKIENIEKDCVLKELSELESIAIKYGEKETPYKPTGIEPIGMSKIGFCKCTGEVLLDENYCSTCGQKLDWSE